MYMIWSTKNKPFRDCSLWYRGCYAIGWAIEGCPGKGILDNPHIFRWKKEARNIEQSKQMVPLDILLVAPCAKNPPTYGVYRG